MASVTDSGGRRPGCPARIGRDVRSFRAVTVLEPGTAHLRGRPEFEREPAVPPAIGEIGRPLWAVALNALSGFQSVPETLRMSGRNFGLKGARYVGLILIPAAFPSILAGLKVGWAFAWRTLIAAELVFGVSSRSGGLGWYIFEKKNQLLVANVFAGLLTVIVLGLLVENLIFQAIEKRTVRRWGMQV